jgi:hypothetical protein
MVDWLPYLPSRRTVQTAKLVDRFSFIYDVVLCGALLLVRARACRCAALACLTGCQDRRPP